jgi:hypothetical protein
LLFVSLVVSGPALSTMGLPGHRASPTL